MSTCQDEDNIFLNCKDEENIFPNFLSVGLLSHCSIQCDCRQPIVWSLESERPQNRYLLVKTIHYPLSTEGDWWSRFADWRWLAQLPDISRLHLWTNTQNELQAEGCCCSLIHLYWALCISRNLHQLSLTNFIRTSIKRKHRKKEWQDITFDLIAILSFQWIMMFELVDTFWCLNRSYSSE